jgi:hypothetical protein
VIPGRDIAAAPVLIREGGLFNGGDYGVDHFLSIAGWRSCGYHRTSWRLTFP